MDKRSKIKVKTNWAFITTFVGMLFCCALQANFNNPTNNLLLKKIDSIPTKKIGSANLKALDTLSPFSKDSTPIAINDSIQKFDSLTISKDSIDAPISYEASDSGVLIIPTRDFYLYGKAKVSNKDVTLDAATIKYEQAKQVVQAYGALDTTGNPNSKPKLTQGETKTISDSILFSLKTLKGLTKNTYVQDGEMFVNAQVLKKVSADEFYGFKARFTTCNLDTPHFAFRARKIKMVTNMLAVSGPTSAEIESIPIPIGIPFGIYPLHQGRHSGVLAPAYAVSEDYGLGLEGLGYYKVVNDYLDITTRSNIYSYGGWTLNINPKYQKRYRYQGGLSLTFQNTKALNRASFGSYSKEEYNSTRSFMINWNHSQDQRVRPGTNLSANVNFGSTRYNTAVLNNPYVNFQNQLSSSVNYSKDFRGKANVSLNLNHSQNNNTHLVNLILPTMTASVVTFYPFQKKEQVGTPKWYEKLGVGYSGNFSNQVAFYDTAFRFKQLLDTLQWGATHSIPISIALPQLGPITISPSVSFEQKWYGQTITRSWNGKKVDTLIRKGFYTGSQVSFGISASTRIFGTYLFSKKSNVQAIRHEIRPSVSFSYKPDLASGSYYSTQVDTFKHFTRFSKFDGVIPGAYSEGNFGGISFGVDNLLEMKVKDKKDTSKPDATKKVKLIDGFGVNSSYNLLADSFALAPFQFYARSTLFSVINITASFTMDPYAVDEYGYRLKNYTWTTSNPTLGRITNGNIAVSTSFKSKSKDGKPDKDRIPKDPFMTPEEQQQQLQYARSNPAEYTDFNIPWTLSLSYSLSYTKQLQSDYSYANIITSSTNFNGDFSLTEKWKLGGTGYYDFNAAKLQQLSMFITREMHCWQLAINVSPIGLFRSFNITFSPKAGILRDLKINRSRYFSNY